MFNKVLTYLLILTYLLTYVLVGVDMQDEEQVSPGNETTLFSSVAFFFVR